MSIAARGRELVLPAGVALLAAAVALPFFGWAGLETEGPAIGLLGGSALLLAVPNRRLAATLALLSGIAASVLIAIRLATPPGRSNPVLRVLLRAGESRASLWAALVGAVMVAVAGAMALAPSEAGASTAGRIHLDAEQRRALSIAWRALLSSRLLVWVAGLVAIAAFGSHHSVADEWLIQPFGSFLNRLVAPASQWDANVYLSIAQHGYAGGHYFDAFFPLYPIVVRLGSWSPRAAVITGVATSWIALLVALYLLHRLVSLDFPRGVAELTVWLTAFFPMALFFSAIYTESLFLALSVGSIYAARRGSWLWAGIAGGLAAATRATGILLLVPLAVMYLYGPRDASKAPHASGLRPRFPMRSDLAFLALVPAGALLYLAYQGAHGDFFAPFHSQTTFWDRSLSPAAGLLDGVRDSVLSVRQLIGGGHILSAPSTGEFSDPARLATANLTDFGFLAFAVVAVIGAVRTLPAAYSAYAVASFAVLISSTVPVEPLASFPRYLAVVFPCQMWLAVRLQRRSWRHGVLLVSAALLALFASEFARGLWVA